jgi:DNA-directed RNA polymerase specialized sigma24 family protein
MLKRVPSGGDSELASTFETEVLPHADRLFRMALWLERTRTDAEDVAQDTLMQALRSFHRFRPERTAAPSPWPRAAASGARDGRSCRGTTSVEH